MKKGYLFLTLIHMLVLPISCSFSRNNPIDEGGPNFIPPAISFNEELTSVKDQDTIHFDSVTIDLVGNREQSIFQIKLDTGEWKVDWQPEGVVGIGGLSDGAHTILINTMYRGGEMVVSDTINFYVLTKGFKPAFSKEDNTTITSFGGKPITLVASAKGASPLQYSWLKGDSVLAGKKKDTLAFTSFSVKDTGSYKCAAVNEYGTDTSRTFTLKFRASTGGIKGIVTDTSEKILKSVVVKLSHSDKQVTTGTDGKFEFSALSDDTYTLKFTLKGYVEKTIDDIKVNDSDVVDIKGVELEWIDTTTYKVTYNGNGSESGDVPVDTIKYTPGSKIAVTDIGNLAKTGHSFSKWNTKKEGTGDTVSPGDTFTVNTNVTFYAQWKVNQYTVSFKTEEKTSGDVPEPVKYNYQQTVTIPEKGSLERAGYTFKGWKKGEKVYQANDTFPMPASDVELAAQWEAMPTYAVKYDKNSADSGTVPIDSSSYYKGKDVTVAGNPGNLYRDGYSFAGWNTKPDGNGDTYNAGSKLSMPDSAIILYAKWTTNPTYSIIYHTEGSSGGTAPATATADSGAQVTIADSGSLFKTGYTFVEWNTQEDGKGKVYKSGDKVTLGAVNIDLYGQWKARYKVTYHGNGNTGGYEPVTFECDSGGGVTIADSGSLVKTGYTFVEWNSKEDGSGNAYSIGQQITIGAANIDLYAKWTKAQYTVTYHGNGNTSGNPPPTTNHLYGSDAIVANAGSLQKIGHTFYNWNTDSLGAGIDYSAGTYIQNISENIDLYAKWNKNNYTITFKFNNGANDSNQTVSHGDTIKKPSDPLKQSYLFSGWTNDSNSTQYWDFSTKIVEPVTLYAKWIIKDIIGNIYTEVKIGNQVWMVENLKTTKYNDGTSIPYIASNNLWANLSTGGYCWYDHDSLNYKSDYGALYNWYVVNSNKLAPSGWHVPTSAEWDTLVAFLGGKSIAGGKLKEPGVAHWMGPNTVIDNAITGFLGLPGGERFDDGSFNSLYNFGTWWTATEGVPNTAFCYSLSYGNTEVFIDGRYVKIGLSVRCIRNW